MNIYDVAKIAGVSSATVSRVLNGTGYVKESTRKKVMAVIEQADYVPNAQARSLSAGESQTIAFMIPDIENPFFNKILHGITDKAAEADYNVFMFGTDESPLAEHRSLSALNSELIKGLIIIPVSEEDEITKEKLQRFAQRNIPVVLLDRDTAGGSFDGVFSDDRAGCIEAVDCLVDAGHHRIAAICGPVTSRPGRERLKGYRLGLEKHKIEINPEYIVDGKFRMEESYQAMKRLMEMETKPTAVLTANNMTTLGCLKYMKEHRLKLCRDVSLIGFDDIPELVYTDINLTVITRPVYQMGCEAMKLLEQRLREKYNHERKGVLHRRIVKTELIKRGSEKIEVR